MFELKITADTLGELLVKIAALGALGTSPASAMDVPLPDLRITGDPDAVAKPKRTKRVLPVTEAEHAALDNPPEPEAVTEAQPWPRAPEDAPERPTSPEAHASEADASIAVAGTEEASNSAMDATDDDADAEGLAGASEAQDKLDAEVPDDLPAEFQTFVNAVEAAKTFVEVKTALATFFGTPLFKGMPLDQQNHVRYQTWATLQDRKDEGTFTDLPDPSVDVSAFRLWVEAQDEGSEISRVLAGLEAHPGFSGKPDEFKAGIRKAAAERVAALAD